jgi:ATP synthase protein I
VVVEEEGRTPFDRRLREARQRAGLDAPPKTPIEREPHPLAIAARIGAEMVATLAVACAIGWGLDRWFGTRPWCLVAAVPVGVAAGVKNLMRFAAPPGTTGGDQGGRGR